MKTYYLIDPLTAELRQYDGSLRIECQILVLPDGNEVSLYGAILCETKELAIHNQRCARRHLIAQASDLLDDLTLQMQEARMRLDRYMAIGSGLP